MTDVPGNDQFDTLAERAKVYSGHSFVGDVTGRALGFELTWAKLGAIREGDDSQLATGALRACIDDAIRLAATPATTTEEAGKKIRGLRRARERLAEVADRQDPVRWEPLLSAALRAEAERWNLSEDAPPEDESKVVGQRRARKPSPPLEAHYRRRAGERTFSSSLREVASIETDIDSLLGVNAAAIEGARFELLIAVLRAAATSVTSQDELVAKAALLQRDPDLLAPTWQIRPMIEAVITDEFRDACPPAAVP